MLDFSGVLHQFSQSRNAFNVLNAFLMLLIALSTLLWVRVYLDRDYNRLLTASQSLPQNSAGVGINTDELIAYNLFGASNSTEPTTQKNIPLSSLNLKLTGVVASDRGGFALISVNGQPQSPFFIGEVVTRNAVLDQVLPDRVILRRGSSRESLLLDNDDQLPGQSAELSAAPSSLPNSVNSIENLGGNNYAVSKNVVVANVDNMEILQQALIVPNKDGGFLVKNVQQNGVFAKLGLRKGDVIKKVNGLPVNTMVDVMQLYRLANDINKISNIRVELDREGVTQTLNYSLK